MMKRKELESLLLNLPQMAAWPELSDLLRKALDHPRQV